MTKSPPAGSAPRMPDRSALDRAVRAVLDRQAWGLSQDIRLRLAGMADIPVLRALNAAAIRGLGREGLFLRMSEDFLSEMIRGGVIVLPQRDGKVLGYSIAVPAGLGHPPFFPEKSGKETGLLLGTALDPALRGQGCHTLLILIRLEIFREMGFPVAQSTVSPFNVASLCNLLGAGFHVCGLKPLLDERLRFLLLHDFGRTVGAAPFRILSLPEYGDLPDHAALLREGFIAVGLERRKPVTLFYAAGFARHHQSGDPAT